MFSDCDSITDLDLRNFNTSNVTDMSFMFADCKRMFTLQLGNWDTSNVTTMQLMFTQCKSLTSLDLSSFNTRKCTNSDIFGSNDYLKTVKLGANFSFVSEKNNEGLPYHNTMDVPEWDGKWYAASTGIGYDYPHIPPAYKDDTYYAVKSMLQQ